MLEIILVITVGKYFYRLADKYKKASGDMPFLVW